MNSNDWGATRALEGKRRKNGGSADKRKNETREEEEGVQKMTASGGNSSVKKPAKAVLLLIKTCLFFSPTLTLWLSSFTPFSLVLLLLLPSLSSFPPSADLFSLIGPLQLF